MNSEILDRLPPQDINSEKSLLGSVLLNPACLDELDLSPDEFHAEANSVLFGHLQGMRRTGKGIDGSLLLDRLRSCDDLERIGGPAYLSEVLESVAVAAHWRHYAEIVRKHAQKRSVIIAATEALRDAYDPGIATEAILERLEGSLRDIQTGSYDSAPVPMSKACEAAMERVEKIVKREAQAGVFTGIVDFDNQVGGFFQSELAIIAARPGQGKTSLAIQMACHMSDSGRRVYFATLEMGAAEIAMKRICSASGVGGQAVRTGKIGPDEGRRLTEASGAVSTDNLVLHDWPSIRTFDIERAARRANAEVVFVDYLQIVTPMDKKAQRYEQVGSISNGLKGIARRLEVPVIACCQLGRQSEQHKETAPKLHHLRESGNIENDADMVLLLWRPEGGVPTTSGGKADSGLEVAKNRNGATCRLLLDFDANTTTFRCHGEYVSVIENNEWTPDGWLPPADDF
jgi:replicative DNA helicase